MKARSAGSIVVALALSSAPILAHHAFSAVFDLAKQRDFKGTISKVEWLNPHAHFLVDPARRRQEPQQESHRGDQIESTDKDQEATAAAIG